MLCLKQCRSTHRVAVQCFPKKKNCVSLKISPQVYVWYDLCTNYDTMQKGQESLLKPNKDYLLLTITFVCSNCECIFTNTENMI